MDCVKKDVTYNYRVLMQDDSSELTFAIFVTTIGMVTAERAALDEFPWAHVIGITQR